MGPVKKKKKIPKGTVASERSSCLCAYNGKDTAAIPCLDIYIYINVLCLISTEDETRLLGAKQEKKYEQA